MEEKNGTIAEIIYYNKENCYAILVIETEDEQFTAVGYMPGAEKGRAVVLEGSWKVHPQYGEQFAFSSYEEKLPATAAGIEAFLCSGTVKGIGKKTASLIVEKFGTDTLRIISEEPDRLTEIDGIGQVKAASIHESYQSHREFAEITMFLQQYGISAAYAMKLYRVYEGETIAKVKENPYCLVNDIFGIGFHKADKLAEAMGIDRRDEFRIRSGIHYGLWVYVNEGHTYAPQKEFCEKTAGLLDISSEEVYEQLVQMAFEGDIYVERIGGISSVYLAQYRNAELAVCKKLIALNEAARKPVNVNVELAIAGIEKETGMELSDNQKFAVTEALNNGVSVITGGPGTGKTTIINTIMGILELCGFKTAIAAPTGRAAKRITETSGYPASTIHRLLEYYYSEGMDAMCFGKNAEDLLDYEAIIIDEASMVDILLMKGLLDAVNPGTRVVIVGDADQLPSVGAGNVLRDIIDSEIIYSVKLTEIFRQARESLIVVNAHRINKGEYPACNEKGKDFFLLRKNDERKIVETLKDLCLRRLPNYYESCVAIRDIQVLTPVRKGNLGSLSLNRELQEILNPQTGSKQEKKVGERIFREGDKVMQIRNNYQLEWKRTDTFIEGEGVFNGDVGFVQLVDNEFGYLTVIFDDNKSVRYEFSQLDEIELAYAVTVHKSQGSEFPIVVMPVSWFPPMLATRNLLYTAVTRARQAVVLVGDEGRINAMVDNNRIISRYSGLVYRLRSFLELPESDGVETIPF